ncbi:hypothetical protein F4777DRAFT_49946 [Nemania sp. FL0916]|nr:hypothetical protein F4777DRAFT_49946 [Nemania sp. FL0916]
MSKSILSWAVACWLPVLAYSLASADTSRSEVGDTVECEPIEKYTSQWFLINTREQYRDSLPSNALFYSRDMSSAARAIAADLGLVTIWDLWDCTLYYPDNIPSNPMRCIFNDETQRRSFFENMSLAFAQKACDGASVLHSFQYYFDPPLDGIWGTVELPELMKHDGAVHWLRKLRMHHDYPIARGVEPSETQGGQRSAAENVWWASRIALDWLQSLRVHEGIAQWSQIFWRRPGHEYLTVDPVKELKRRGDSGEGIAAACLSRDQLGFFDKLPIW